MESLEIQEKVINLGKKLLRNFEQNDPDQVTSWMINYLAEQITLAERTNCELTKKLCFDTILQLWESHAAFPDGTRPFESFEPIFKALESLSPESANRRYFTNQSYAGKNDELDHAAIWLETAKDLDAAARILITFIFEQAIARATTEETKSWLKTLSGTVDVNEIAFILKYDNEISPTEPQQKIEKLVGRIAQLELFESFSQATRKELEKEVADLKNSIKSEG